MACTEAGRGLDSGIEALRWWRVWIRVKLADRRTHPAGPNTSTIRHKIQDIVFEKVKLWMPGHKTTEGLLLNDGEA
jgi:hypothetical protein